MCPICWITGFIAALFGGSLLAIVNHPISWILSIILLSYAIFKSLKETIGLRISKAAEKLGTDKAEVGVTAYSIRD